MAAITGFVHWKIRSVSRPPSSRCSISDAPPPVTAPDPSPAAADGVERVAAATEVGAGAEAPAPAGDDHHPDLVVGVDAVEGVAQLALHRDGEGVQPVGAVEGDGGDAVGDLEIDVVHAGMVARASTTHRAPMGRPSCPQLPRMPDIPNISHGMCSSSACGVGDDFFSGGDDRGAPSQLPAPRSSSSALSVGGMAVKPSLSRLIDRPADGPARSARPVRAPSWRAPRPRRAPTPPARPGGCGRRRAARADGRGTKPTTMPGDDHRAETDLGRSRSCRSTASAARLMNEPTRKKPASVPRIRRPSSLA